MTIYFRDAKGEVAYVIRDGVACCKIVDYKSFKSKKFKHAYKIVYSSGYFEYLYPVSRYPIAKIEEE